MLVLTQQGHALVVAGIAFGVQLCEAPSNSVRHPAAHTDYLLAVREEGLHLLPPWILMIWYPPVIARTLFRSGGSMCDITLESSRSRFRMSATWMPAPPSSSPSATSPCRTLLPARSVVTVVSSVPSHQSCRCQASANHCPLTHDKFESPLNSFVTGHMVQFVAMCLT